MFPATVFVSVASGHLTLLAVGQVLQRSLEPAMYISTYRGGVPMFLSTPWGVDVSGFRLAVVGALRPAGGVRRPFPCGPVQATRAGSW
ncbi:hypothetical protein GBK01_11000 [Bifidobacterium longum]|nr:hypothetical protein GBK01_11000 [Bifidobacterium longum]